MSILTGTYRIGRDAELRFLPSGEPVINLSLAYNFGRRDTDGKRATQWIEAGLWGKRAEALAKHLLKRAEVWCVIEDVHIETFERREAGMGHKLVGRIQMIEFVGTRRDDGPGENSSAAARPAPTAAPRSRTPPPAPDPDETDDIPF